MIGDLQNLSLDSMQFRHHKVRGSGRATFQEPVQEGPPIQPIIELCQAYQALAVPRRHGLFSPSNYYFAGLCLETMYLCAT